MESVAALTEALNKAGIETQKWIHPNRTVADLFEELVQNECVLDLTARTRTIRTLCLDVFARSDENFYRLYESSQVLDSKFRPIRRLRKKSAVTEKLRLDEAPDDDAVLRALGEELQIAHFHKRIFTNVEKYSHRFGYPGLTTHNTLYHFRVSLRDQDFKAAGYQEKTHDRTIYFTWQLHKAKKQIHYN